MHNNLDAENTKLWGMYNSKKPDILYLGTDIYGCDELWWKDNNFDFDRNGVYLFYNEEFKKQKNWLTFVL